MQFVKYNVKVIFYKKVLSSVIFYLVNELLLKMSRLKTKNDISYNKTIILLKHSSASFTLA